MKKGERKAATRIQRHVRGWRARRAWPLLADRGERKARELLVSPETRTTIENCLKAYVLEDARTRFLFPPHFDAAQRRVLMDRATLLGFEYGQETRGDKVVAYVQRPPSDSDPATTSKSPADVPTGGAAPPPRTTPSAAKELFAPAPAASAAPAEAPVPRSEVGSSASGKAPVRTPAQTQPSLSASRPAAPTADSSAAPSGRAMDGLAQPEPPRKEHWKTKAAQDLADVTVRASPLQYAWGSGNTATHTAPCADDAHCPLLLGCRRASPSRTASTR